MLSSISEGKNKIDNIKIRNNDKKERK